jgi:hypothetical protein
MMRPFLVVALDEVMELLLLLLEVVSHDPGGLLRPTPPGGNALT